MEALADRSLVIYFMKTLSKLQWHAHFIPFGTASHVQRQLAMCTTLMTSGTLFATYLSRGPLASLWHTHMLSTCRLLQSARINLAYFIMIQAA